MCNANVCLRAVQGPLVNADVDQPLLLQLLNQVTDSSSSNWHAAAAKADPPHQRSSRAAGNQTATAAAGSRHSMSLPRQQLRDGSAAAPEAAPVPVEAKASAGQLETDVCNAASAASKLPSKSTSLLGTASVAEDSSLIGTQLAEEDTSQEYATVLVSPCSTWQTGLQPIPSNISTNGVIILLQLLFSSQFHVLCT